MSRPVVVAARPDETAVLARLHAGCFARPWDGDAVARLLAQPGAFALLGRLGGDRPVDAGFALARTAADEGEVLSVGVLPDYRRRGLARALIAGVAGRARADGADALLLEVDQRNHAAVALYRRLGSAEVARRPGYSRQAGGRPRDALVMRLALTRDPAESPGN